MQSPRLPPFVDAILTAENEESLVGDEGDVAHGQDVRVPAANPRDLSENGEKSKLVSTFRAHFSRSIGRATASALLLLLSWLFSGGEAPLQMSSGIKSFPPFSA